MEGIIINLISGAVGGNVAGGLLKKFSMGPVLNSVMGIIGGGVGGQLMGMLGGDGMTDAAGAVADVAGGMDVGALVGQFAAGGAGGGVLMVVVGLVKNMMSKGE